MAALGAILPGLAFAQTRSWTNNSSDNLWGTAGNWTSGNVPTASNNVQINANDNDSVVNDIDLGGVSRSANSLIFNSVNDDFKLYDGSLTLTSGGISRNAFSTGSQTIGLTTLTLGANSAMNIAGNGSSAGSLTISANITDGAGTYTLTKTGSAELILSGSNDYGGATTLNGGKLTLASSSALGSSGILTMQSGTLKLSTATTNLTTLHVTGNSTIDFSSTDATLSVGTLTIDANVTLTITGWTNAMDHFFAANWTGATYNATGANPMNQVVFSPTYTANDTKWLEYGSHEITPVPEPSTYGALLLGATTALVYWQRRRVNRPST